MRAAVYGRESKDKTKSVDDQVRENLAACERLGWSVVDTFTDGVSASRFSRAKTRPGWAQLAAAVDAGRVDVIVVWEPSRGDRDLETWVAFVAKCRTRGVKIHATSHQSTYDPGNLRQWRTLVEDGLDAAYESEKLSSRVLKGVNGAAAAGKAHGAAQYGYTRVYDQHDRKVFTQHPDEHAPVVAEIFERVGKSDPIIAVARDLDARGIPSPAGGSWRRQTIRAMVRNPAYAGYRGHNGERHRADWAPIVTDRVWRDANRVLDAPGRRTAKPGQQTWLLSYLATSTCGALLHGVPSREGRRPRYQCHADGCVSIGRDELDELVTRVMVGRLARADVRELFAADDTESRQADAEAAALTGQLDGWRESAIRGETSPASLAKIEAGLTERIRAAQRRARASMPASLAELVDAERELVRPAWERLPLAARREIIALFAAVTVGPASALLTRWSTDADRRRAAVGRVRIEWRS